LHLVLLLEHGNSFGMEQNHLGEFMVTLVLLCIMIQVMEKIVNYLLILGIMLHLLEAEMNGLFLEME
jgi:hypothetical protein